MRGINSKANAVTRRSASAAIGLGSQSGSHKRNQDLVGLHLFRNGQRLLRIGRAGANVHDDVRRIELRSAWRRSAHPAAEKSASGKPDGAPAPDFDHDLKARLFERAKIAGHERHATLARRRLFRNADRQRLMRQQAFDQFACGIFVVSCGKARL